MATNANPVDASRKDEEGVKEVQTHIPGVGEVTAYFLVETVDDVDGKTKEDIQTLRFSVPVEVSEEVDDLDEDGKTKEDAEGNIKTKTESFYKTVHYEVDLGKASRDKLDKALAPFLKNAREATAPLRGSQGALTASANKSAHDLVAIREWAKGAGHEVATKGKVAGKVIEAYYRSTGKTNPDA
ncbi:histone-like nucleoid-structuring protein Lsr2 [Streptomyces sp. NPDC060223]|uniref:Lsr2 family DNA-binding protein n=1 Tax=unclassified Streptomyces TaxID=2593676 RepID=UPI003639C102